MTVEKLAKHHAMTNYARAEKQSIEDASYIQDVAYYSFIEGYKAASSKEVESEEELKMIIEGLKFSWGKISEMRKTYAGLGPIEHGIKRAYFFLKEQTNPVDNIESREIILDKFMMFAKAVEEKAKELHDDPLYIVSVAIQEWLKEQTKEVSNNPLK